MYVLMHFDLMPDVLEDIKGTVKYMINNRFRSGNYPSCVEDVTEDILVHWCHGAPGMTLTLVKATEIFEDKDFLEVAIDAGEVIWKRGLLKRVGLCHGEKVDICEQAGLGGNNKSLWREMCHLAFN